MWLGYLSKGRRRDHGINGSSDPPVSTGRLRRVSDTGAGPRSAEVRFVFGDCLLDPDRRELTRGSKVVSIGPQVFDLLLHLVRNRERVSSKDDLLQAVWGGR